MEKVAPTEEELRMHRANNAQGVGSFKRRAKISLAEAIVEMEKVSGYIPPGRPGGAHSATPIHSSWFGLLTHQNIDAVVYKLGFMLTERRYAFVVINEAMGHRPGGLVRPGVRTGQVLAPEQARDGRAVHVYHKGDWIGYGGADDRHTASGFNVVDSGGVWGCVTAADDGAPDDGGKTPYFAFDYERVTIEHRAPAGHRLIWTIALERDDS